MYQFLTEAISKDTCVFRQYLKAYYPWIVREPFCTDGDRYHIFDLAQGRN